MRSIRHGEVVLAQDGTRLGHVDRIVVDESARRVTHVVVEDRAIPVDRVTDAGGALTTDLLRTDLAGLPAASQRKVTSSSRRARARRQWGRARR